MTSSGDEPGRPVDALLARTSRAADRMVRMLDQNMEFGVVGTTPPRVEVDLGRVARQLVLDSAVLLESSGASVEIGTLPVVRADPDDMYSVLQNLLTNAVKFTHPDRAPVVAINARSVEDRWRVSVTDNGVGIPEDRRADVFGLFSRVDEEVEGHGIGLATVSRVIGSLGGRLGVEDVMGGGTEIWFEVPGHARTAVTPGV